MKKSQICESLREKFNDEYTIKMFANFIQEFEECFGDLLSTEEVIHRIKQNVLGNIKIVDKFDNEKLDGRYGDDGIVYLKRDTIKNEKYIKYLLFHELLHAITSVRDKDGTEKMLGFSYINNSYGMGLNEAMTEFLTQIRNERFESNREDLVSDYRVVVEQMRRMINIFGLKELTRYYFYEPEKFKDFVNSKGMDYEELELAFRKLCGKDREVYNIGNGKKLDDTSNYTVYRFSKMIFDNLSNAIGEVNTLEEFENKYKHFQTYTDGNCDCLSTMLISYYRSIGNDINRLLSKGTKIDSINEALHRLNIRIDVLNTFYTVSKLFVQDKNQTAINLYELYIKNPSLYFSIFAQNYAYFFEHFRESDAVPGDELYDALKYPLIGMLLKSQPQIDYSDLSYYKIEEPKSKINIYLFYTSDSKIYGYTAKGEKIIINKDEEGNNTLEMKIDEQCSCKMTHHKDGKISFSFMSKDGFDLERYMQDVKFKMSHHYSEKSDIEYWIQELEKDEHGKGDSERLNTVLKKIDNRIANRQARNYVE